MSSCRLIHSGQGLPVRIELFREQNLGGDEPGAGPGAVIPGPVRLPLFRDPREKDPEKAWQPGEKGAPSETPTPDMREQLAQDKLALLEREAYQKGFEQGRKDGQALENRQMEERARQMEILFSELTNCKAQLYEEAEEELLRLSLLLAKKIVREEIRTQGSVVQRVLRDAITFLADRGRIRIRIHPEDMEEVRDLLPELASRSKGGQFQVTEDRAIERGGCLLETGFGRINATVQDQLAVLEEEMETAFRNHREKTE
ncbi:MAG: hypothetical protein JW821_13150 [Deltaproteobacteria bacterium]|nr:hypothetical protein [Deltaproteobacteria bacterium]